MFRVTLFWERSILIIKEARAKRINLIEEVAARGREAGGAARAGVREQAGGLRTGTALRDDPGADANACAANGERV